MPKTRAQLEAYCAQLERERDSAVRELAELGAALRAIHRNANQPAQPRASSTCAERARQGWGAEMPAWIRELAACCDASSQVAVARLIGYSPAAINQVLARRYVGRVDRVEARFRSLAQRTKL